MLFENKVKILIAILVTVSSFFFYRYSSQTQILVATAPIFRGSGISRDCAKWEPVDPAKINENSIVEGKLKEVDLQELVALRQINKGEVITADMLLDKRRPDYADKMLRIGYRAFSLSFPTNMIKTQSITVGSHVDISVSYSENIKISADTLVYNVMVLSITEGENKTSDVLLEIHPSLIKVLLDGKKVGTLFISLLKEEESVKEGDTNSEMSENSITSTVKVIRREGKTSN